MSLNNINQELNLFKVITMSNLGEMLKFDSGSPKEELYFV